MLIDNKDTGIPERVYKGTGAYKYLVFGALADIRSVRTPGKLGEVSAGKAEGQTEASVLNTRPGYL